ncbi:MAG: hypothetical protein M3209_00195 [Acidobacteriota bacterium]|nr:hypothetical protein [Acidobacteriota bacterium]
MINLEEIEAMSGAEFTDWAEINPTLAKGFIYCRETGLSIEQVMNLPIDDIDRFIDAFYVVCLHKKRARELQAASLIPLASELVM